MSYMLPHLNNGWEVDQAILSEEERVVVSLFLINNKINTKKIIKFFKINKYLIGY